ncbi:hypothetical protein HJFPF1_09310 [Paramyrothecium foliicola]|nr:hypothetical protein HJFPF1_09310 [Paramyrothecium foliicola]
MNVKVSQQAPQNRDGPQAGYSQRAMTEPNRFRISNRRSSLGYSYVFAPRAFHEVFTERAYLLSALQLQDAVRKQLTEQYSSLADRLLNFETPKQRRMLRKKISQLKPKIVAAAEAQKTVLLRLTEVEMEMQSLQVMTQAHAHSVYLHEWPSPTPTLSSFSSLSDSSSSLSACTTSLNATSPVFIPKRELLELHNPSEPRPLVADASPRALATVEEAGEDFISNHGLRYEYRSPEMLREDIGVAWDGVLLEPRLKRSPSLPSLQCVWPGE